MGAMLHLEGDIIIYVLPQTTYSALGKLLIDIATVAHSHELHRLPRHIQA